MTARRNSPRIGQLSPYAAKVIGRQLSRASATQPVQSQMPGMETDTASIVLVAEKQRRDRKQSDKARFEREFAFQIRSHALPAPFSYINSAGDLSYQFSFATEADAVGVEARKFRADFAWPSYTLLVEIQGGIWLRGGGAHSHPKDIERDIIRQQYAALLGYFVLPITTDQVKNGHGIEWLQRVLYARGWKR